MRKIGLFFIGLLMACSSSMQGWKGDGRVKVLSTTAIVDDMVAAVGGEYIDHLVLIRGALDPHSYELVKGDDEKIAGADLIFYSGLGLEHGASLKHQLEKSPNAVGIGNVIAAECPGALLFVDGTVDPHIWMDVALWGQGVPGVVAALCEADPEHAEAYRQRGAALANRLYSLDQSLRKEMERLAAEKRYLVTSHDAFNYFTRRYLATDEERQTDAWRIRCCAPEGLAPEGQLSLRDIKEVIAHLKACNVSVLFPESNLSRDSIRKIQHAGSKMGLEVRIADCVLYGDAMGEGETYETMMSHNVRMIREQISGS